MKASSSKVNEQSHELAKRKRVQAKKLIQAGEKIFIGEKRIVCTVSYGIITDDILSEKKVKGLLTVGHCVDKNWRGEKVYSTEGKKIGLIIERNYNE